VKLFLELYLTKFGPTKFTTNEKSHVMPTRYFPAPEVKQVAEELIPVYHPTLVDARIEYVFCDKIAKRGGKDIWGTFRKVTNLNAYLGSPSFEQDSGYTTPFFVMVIARPVWENLSTEKRKALVDHELCHGSLEYNEEGDPKLGIVPHDLEEFSCIVKRYGLWREDVRIFVENATKDDETPKVKDSEEEQCTSE